MKKVFFVLLALCSLIEITSAQTPEVKTIEEFMNNFLHGSKDQKKLVSLISPSFKKAIGATGEDVKVNTYSPDNYQIDKQEGNLVSVYIFNKELTWTHRLYFTVIKEDGKHYIKPPDNTILRSWGSFTPWTKVDKRIENFRPDKNLVGKKISTYNTSTESINNNEKTVEKSKTTSKATITISTFADGIKKEMRKKGNKLVYEKSHCYLRKDQKKRLSNLKYNTTYHVVYLCELEEERILTIEGAGHSNNFIPEKVNLTQGNLQAFSVTLNTQSNLKYDAYTSPASWGYFMIFERVDIDTRKKNNPNKGLLNLYRTMGGK